MVLVTLMTVVACWCVRAWATSALSDVDSAVVAASWSDAATTILGRDTASNVRRSAVYDGDDPGIAGTVCRSASSSTCPASTSVRMRRATANNSATWGLVNE